MEALRTQLDNLQWEVNTENRQLREEDVELSAHVALEAELGESRVEVTSA